MYILLLLLWIMFNGQLTLEIFLFGIVFAALIFLFLCKFMDYSIKKDLAYCAVIPFSILYILVLIREIIKANLCMLKFIFFPKKKISPCLVSFKTQLKTKTARVLLANSITLTPGTITVESEEENFVIHCLDKSLANDLEVCIFARLLTKMENLALSVQNKKEAKK